MEINFKDKGVTHTDLMVMAERFDIQNAKNILDEQIAVLAHFKGYAKEIGLSQERTVEIFGHFKMKDQ